MNKYVLIIGTSFPLKGGATWITEFYSRFFTKNDLKIIRFSYNNVFNKKNSQNLNPIFGVNPFIKVISYLLILIRSIFLFKKIKAIYIQESASLFKIFDFFLLYIFSSLKIRCYYHNHSYQKINKFNYLTKIILLTTSRKITNIFLTQKEAKEFIKVYGPTKYHVVSNCIFIDKYDQNIFENNTEKLRFGLISNFHKNKGLDEFIEIAKYAMENKNHGILPSRTYRL